MKRTTHKNLLSRVIILCLLLYFPSKQVKSQGPITPTGLIGQKEMIMIWDEGDNASSRTINHQIVKLITGYEGEADVSKRFEFEDKKQEPDGSYGNRQLDVASGDFNGDGKSEYVVASRAADSKIKLRIPEISPSALTYTKSDTLMVDANVNDASDVHVLSGNFDNDEQDEFILAYKDMNQKLHIELYDTQDGLTPTLIAQTDDETLTSGSANDWGIDVYDLDGDQKDEVIIGFRPDSPGQGVFVKVYKLSGSSFLAKARKLIDNSNLSNNSYMATVAVTAGDFDTDRMPEIALAWGRMDSCGGIGCDDTFIYPLEIGDDNSTSNVDSLEQITFKSSNRYATNLSANDLSALNLKSGDLNGDGTDEIVLGGSFGADVIVADSTLKLTHKNSVGNYYDYIGYAVDFLRVADIDGKPGDEIVILDHYFSFEPDGSQYFTLSVYGFEDDLIHDYKIASKTNIESISNGSGSADRRHYAIATGDFNDDNFRIGEGEKYIKTNIVQPLVILNAPPTHFDVLDDNVYDINSCYNENLADCSQKATYYKSTSETKMVNTEIYSNWGVSAELSAGGSFLGIGAEAYMKTNYGEKFSKTSNNSSTVNISTEISASGDDLIYATVCDYEVWEYPVIAEDNTPKGYIVALVPKLTENRWFPSKERSADRYVPKHEVGNILSYTPYTDLNNPDEAQILRGSYLNGSTDLNESTDATFEVNLNNTFSDETTREHDISLEVGGKVSGWGIELGGSANFETGAISTHTTTVSDDLDIKVHLGPIDRSLGETNFNVTPYVYWANNGALVVDYAARAILPSQGGTATWWSDNYGKLQDPAFILPWRLDPEKGLALQDEERRRQTKSISFSPEEPVADDTLTITALINNFSLKETEDSVAVSFYLDNPDDGGTLLTGINGETVVKTPGIIPAQESAEVGLHWKVPAGLPAFPRIYAVIDPDNTMTEIHEDNNVGWKTIGRSTFTSGVKEENAESLTFSNYHTKCYPNPFNESVSIDYECAVPGSVTFNIYDSKGSLIKTVNGGFQSKGIHTITISTGDLAPGLYYYSFMNRSVYETRKMIKL